MNTDNVKSQMRKGILEYCTLLILKKQRAYVPDIIQSLKKPDTIVLVDPAFADDGKMYPGFEKDHVEALKELADAMYQENIEIEGLNGNFESRFNIVVARGEEVYKSLPCGEMEYDAAGLKKIQIGYRTTGISFIL